MNARPAIVTPWALLAWACLVVPVATAGVASAPSTTRRVVIVSVDGLRPDVLLRAQAPNMRRLMERGSYSLWAVTTPLAVTLPSHTSMLTGVTVEKHGITWNSAAPPGPRTYPARPTLFEVAHRAGLTTAMAAGKSKFWVLAKPGTLDWSSVPESLVITDAAVTDTAVAWIERSAPRVLFVHLPGVDTAGHRDGWGSASQLAAVAVADQCLGRLVAALGQRGVMESSLVILTSDHGGAGKTHGAGDERSLHIPWIAAGPSVRPDHDLTLESSREIRTEDTFATACAFLGLDLPSGIDGRPVTEIFEPVPPPPGAVRAGR